MHCSKGVWPKAVFSGGCHDKCNSLLCDFNLVQFTPLSGMLTWDHCIWCMLYYQLVCYLCMSAVIVDNIHVLLVSRTGVSDPLWWPFHQDSNCGWRRKRLGHWLGVMFSALTPWVDGKVGRCMHFWDWSIWHLLRVIPGVDMMSVCRPALRGIGRGEEGGREEVQGGWRGIQRAVWWQEEGSLWQRTGLGRCIWRRIQQ